MSISGLKSNATLYSEYSRVSSSSDTVVNFANATINSITFLTDDPNYVLTASPQEVQFINSLLVFMQNLIVQIPKAP